MWYKNNQDNDFNNKALTNLDSITVNKDPSSDKELANKKTVDESLGSGNILRYNQTLQNYLKVSVGNKVYSLNKYDKIQSIDVTEIRSPNATEMED